MAIADNPRFDVETAELERGGPSYSVETLRALAPRLAPERPWFVIGSDAFAEIDTWREPEAVLSLAHFAVVTRPPSLAGSLADCLPASLRPRFRLDPDGRSGRHREAGTRLRLLRITALDVSASEIRARLREGRSVRYLLPEAVHDAVVKSGIYRDA
jgi:nicotinate-nucleotide adenylyltransferase